MKFLKRFAHIDFAAAVGAATFAIAAQHHGELLAFASVEVAASFALIAFGRWYQAGRA